MTILQLVTKRQYRGAEVFAANLSTELIKLDHKIIFAGLYDNFSNELIVEGAKNIDLSQKKINGLSLVLVKDLVKLLKVTKPDLVQCNGSDTLKYMVMASFFAPKVPVVYRNISMISEWMKGGAKQIIYRQVFRRIDHVTSVGEESRQDFIKTVNYSPTRISVIRRGIPIPNLSERAKNGGDYKRKLNIKREEKVVMHVGNFSPEKNHLFLIDLFTDIRKERKDIKLVCVGTGLLFESIKSKIEERGLTDTIILTGFRKDIPELLAVADCFVLCSKVEGVPGVVLEAAAQKKPTVATNVGGVSEVLVDGKTGYLIKNFDQEAFRNKLMVLLLDEQKRKTMGENAFTMVKEEFSPRKNARKFEELYLNVVQEVK